MASDGSRRTRRFPAAAAAAPDELTAPTRDRTTTSVTAININDPRYPRPTWFRTLRTAAIRSPLLLLAYPAIFALNLLLAVVRSGVPALSDPATYLDATLLPWLASLPALPLIALVLAVPLLAIVDIAYLSRIARRDKRQEQAVMQERMIDIRLTQTRIDAVRFSEGHLPSMAGERARVNRAAPPPASTQLPGVPNDLARLPEPLVFVGREEELAWLA